jgi:hypothetical protein
MAEMAALACMMVAPTPPPIPRRDGADVDDKAVLGGEHVRATACAMNQALFTFRS